MHVLRKGIERMQRPTIEFTFGDNRVKDRSTHFFGKGDCGIFASAAHVVFQRVVRRNIHAPVTRGSLGGTEKPCPVTCQGYVIRCKSPRIRKLRNRHTAFLKEKARKPRPKGGGGIYAGSEKTRRLGQTVRRHRRRLTASGGGICAGSEKTRRLGQTVRRHRRRLTASGGGICAGSEKNAASGANRPPPPAAAHRLRRITPPTSRGRRRRFPDANRS